MSISRPWGPRGAHGHPFLLQKILIVALVITSIINKIVSAEPAGGARGSVPRVGSGAQRGAVPLGGSCSIQKIIF